MKPKNFTISSITLTIKKVVPAMMITDKNNQ